MRRLSALLIALLAASSAAPARADSTYLLKRGTKVFIGTKVTQNNGELFKPCKQAPFPVQPTDVVKETSESCDFVTGIGAVEADGSVNMSRLNSIKTRLTNLQRASQLLSQPS